MSEIAQLFAHFGQTTSAERHTLTDHNTLARVFREYARISTRFAPCVSRHILQSPECTHTVFYQPQGKASVCEAALWETSVCEQRPISRCFPFQLDEFQREAMRCVDMGHTLFVSAPTSAGKTLVAEYILTGQRHTPSQRIIYTAPTKTLCNQKYRQLSAKFADVGLLTGDICENSTARCLVVTAEVLHSQVLGDLPLCRDPTVTPSLAWVIVDEVQYISDPQRGHVWEQTIMMLAPRTRLLLLSASVTTAETRLMAEWLVSLSSAPVHVIVTQQRPVPLRHYVCVSSGTACGGQACDGIHQVVNERGEFSVENYTRAQSATVRDSRQPRRSKRQKQATNSCDSCADTLRVCRLMSGSGLLPCIVFCFSRRECELLATRLASLQLISASQRSAIVSVFARAVADRVPAACDRQMPQLKGALALLARGVGLHHGGLLPLVREVTEIMFDEGLVPLLVCTETFAVGVNSGARSVVFCGCRKYDGNSTRPLSAAEYMQMAGRAGRRGSDVCGVVVAVISAENAPDAEVLRSMMCAQPDVLVSRYRLTVASVLTCLSSRNCGTCDHRALFDSSFRQFRRYSRLRCLYTTLMDRLSTWLHTQQCAPLKRDFDAVMTDIVAHRELYARKLLEERTSLREYLTPGRVIKVRCGRACDSWCVIVEVVSRAVAAADTRARSDPVTLFRVRHLPSPVTHQSCTTSTSHQCCSDHTTFEAEDVSIDRVADVSCLLVDLSSHPATLSSQLPSIHHWLVCACEQRYGGVPCLCASTHLRRCDRPTVALQLKLHVLETCARNMRREWLETGARLQCEAEVRRLSLARHAVTEQQTERDCASHRVTGCDLGEDIREICAHILTCSAHIRHESQEALSAIMRVLQRAELVDDAGLSVQGRVACQIVGADQPLLTWLLFSGCLARLCDMGVCALLTHFTHDHQQQQQAAVSVLPPGGVCDALHSLTPTVDTVCACIVEASAAVTSEQQPSTTCSAMMYAACAWHKDTLPLHEICRVTHLYEGDIVRCLRRTHTLLNRLATVVLSVGNSDLARTFSRISERMCRGIVFAPSLYM